MKDNIMFNMKILTYTMKHVSAFTVLLQLLILFMKSLLGSEGKPEVCFVSAGHQDSFYLIQTLLLS